MATPYRVKISSEQNKRSAATVDQLRRAPARSATPAPRGAGFPIAGHGPGHDYLEAQARRRRQLPANNFPRSAKPSART